MESSSPYSLFGDSSGDYKAGTFTLGGHTLHATPFSGTNGSGIAGKSLSISFTVINESNTSRANSVDTEKPSASHVNLTVAEPSSAVVVLKAARRTSLSHSSYDSQIGNRTLITEQPLVSQPAWNKAFAFFTELGEKRPAKALEITDETLALAFKSIWPAIL